MGWKDKHKFFGAPTYIEHEVEGEKIRFFPIRSKNMFSLLQNTSPIGEALAVLTNDGNSDTGSIFREIGDPATDEKGNPIILKDSRGVERMIKDQETISEAISPELAKLRTKQRAEAIEKLLNCLSDPNTVKDLGEIILDSLNWEANERPPAEEFMSETPLPVLGQLLTGVIKANKGVFGPLGDRLGGLMEALQAKVRGTGEEDGSDQTPQLALKTDGEASATE